MTPQDSRIGSLVIDAVFYDERTAPALQDRLSRVCHDRLQAVISEVLESRLEAGLLYRIDQLSIDAGDIPFDELDDLLPVRVEQALRQALSEAIGEKGSTGGRNLQASVQPLAAAELDLIAHFLLHGSYAWWADATRTADANAVMIKIAASEKETFRQLLFRQGSSETVLRRLSFQFREPAIHAAVAAVEPVESAFIIGFHAGLLEAHREKPLVTASLSSFAAEVWFVIFRFLLAGQGSEFSRREFTRSNLKALAARYNLAYEELLQLLSSTIESQNLKTGASRVLDVIGEIIGGDLPSVYRPSAAAGTAGSPDRFAPLEFFVLHGYPAPDNGSPLSAGELSGLFSEWLSKRPEAAWRLMARSGPGVFAKALLKLPDAPGLTALLISRSFRDRNSGQELQESLQQLLGAQMDGSARESFLRILLDTFRTGAAGDWRQQVAGAARLFDAAHASGPGTQRTSAVSLLEKLPAMRLFRSGEPQRAALPAATAADTPAAGGPGRLLEVLRHYFTHGVFPWWADAALVAGGVRALATQAAEQHGGAFARMLFSAASEPAAGRRIAYQVPAPLLVEALALTTGSEEPVKAWQLLANLLASLGDLLPRSPQRSEASIWEKLLGLADAERQRSFSKEHFLLICLQPLFSELRISPGNRPSILESLLQNESSAEAVKLIRTVIAAQGSAAGGDSHHRVAAALDDYFSTLTGGAASTDHAILALLEEYLQTGSLPEVRIFSTIPVPALAAGLLRRLLSGSPDRLMRFMEKHSGSELLRQIVGKQLQAGSPVDDEVRRLYEAAPSVSVGEAEAAKENRAAVAGPEPEPASPALLVRAAGALSVDHPIAAAAELLRYYLTWQRLPEGLMDGKGAGQGQELLRASMLLLFMQDRTALRRVLGSTAALPAAIMELAGMIHESAGGSERMLSLFITPFRQSAGRQMLSEDFAETGPPSLEENGAESPEASGADRELSLPPEELLELLAYVLRWNRLPQKATGSESLSPEAIRRLVAALYRQQPAQLRMLLSEATLHPQARMTLRRWVVDEAGSRPAPPGLAALFDEHLPADLVLYFRHHTAFAGRSSDELRHWLAAGSFEIGADPLFWRDLAANRSAFLFLAGLLGEDGASALTAVRRTGRMPLRLPSPVTIMRLTGLDKMEAAGRQAVLEVVRMSLLELSLAASPEGGARLPALIARNIAAALPWLLPQVVAQLDAALKAPPEAAGRWLLSRLAQSVAGIMKQHAPPPPSPRETPPARQPAPAAERTAPEKPLELPPPLQKYTVSNAGLVLLHPLLTTFFGRLGLLKEGKFPDGETQARALLLTQYLVTGAGEAEEHELVLNKLLCGLPPSLPVPRLLEPTEAERALTEELFGVVFAQWSKLRNSSVEGFRQSFLRRDGILTFNEEHWTLRIAERAYDVLLSSLPWAFGMIRTPWMDRMLHVEWPY